MWRVESGQYPEACHTDEWSPLPVSHTETMSKVTYSECLRHGTYVGTFVTGEHGMALAILVLITRSC